MGMTKRMHNRPEVNVAREHQRPADIMRDAAVGSSPSQDKGSENGPEAKHSLRAGRRQPAIGHHSGLPFTIIRRRLTAELLDMACLSVEFLASGGRSALRPRFMTGNTLLDLAVRRLAKAGLIACRRTRGKTPILIVTDPGRAQASKLLWPERFWNKRWDGRWHLLTYDVPETERSYRCALERFFRRERMGCLQKSVWISARDIRPLFDDLDLAASLRDFAILFEASPLLGPSPRQVAAQAWDFGALAKRHTAYLTACAKQSAPSPKISSPATALVAARRELFDYLAAMETDPLLPAELLPDDYAGRRVAEVFRARIRLLLRSIFSL
jgi:phenylacetic acid degradation operon negative regulatory protein